MRTAMDPGWLLMVGVLLAAVGVVGTRAWGRRRAQQAWDEAVASRRGFHPEDPVPMLHPGDADEFCEHARCPCGGFLETLGEATSGRLRVVRAECLVCERVVNLYFDPATIRH